MRFDQVRDYLLRLPGAEETFPFGPEYMVFKVGGKMFALLSYEEIPPRINLKCEPALALELRERYAAVQPGYHMSKKHWNTVTLDGSLLWKQVRELVDDSYGLVLGALPKAARAAIEGSAGAAGPRTRGVR
jgi:predicted DNA-binding protein (MmcQ/YjbR family)